MTYKFLILTASVFFVLFLGGCSPATTNSETPKLIAADTIEPPGTRAILIPGSGTYSRNISTESEKAQQFFDQGLRFAWGFYFPESIASYQQAVLHDPNHPMPYWGMAHAMGPNPNSRYARMPDDPKGEGLKAITKAVELIDRATDVEAQLIRALFVLYDKVSIPDDSARDRAYLAKMRELNRQYPDDPDITALYAAAYMSIKRWDYWDSEGNPKGETQSVADALARIIEKDLTHPGVLHLNIHLLEASMEPGKALSSADALEATVPIAGHVVHMPAHIYVRVGQFDKAIANNVRSQEVDQKLAKLWGDMPLPNIGTYPLSHKIHAGHAIDFIRYAATVQGNYTIANEAALKAQKRVLGFGDDVTANQKTVAAPWLVNKIFGQWDQLIDHSPERSGTPYLDGIWAYTLGSALIATGDMAGARIQLDRLRKIADAPGADEYRVGATPASAVLRLCLLGLSGEIFQADGDIIQAIETFEKGVALEDMNNYTEPPDWAQPMRHYLGAALLEAGRAVEAEAVYRRDLRWNQNNGWSLFGLHKALSMQNRQDEASNVRAMYQTAWQHSDIELTRSRK